MRNKLEFWIDNASKDAFILRACAGLNHCIILKSTRDTVTLALSDGSATRTSHYDLESQNSIIIQASDESWSKLLDAEVVEPGWQGFGAILRANSAFTVAGDNLGIAQCLPILERLIEVSRPNQTDSPTSSLEADLSQIQGRYSTISTPNESSQLVYWEGAGDGVPVVMLHTAGADSRQYRHQLADRNLARTWKMFAFDMPGHGRSDMPLGWTEGQPYQLTLDQYLATCIAFIEQVIGEPAIIVGCSMGAAMSLVLAARRPDLVRGVVALEAPWRSPGRKSSMLRDCRVNASLHNPAYVRGMMGPKSPRRYREEACWIYSQAGFGIYAGDLGFYSEEFDGEVIGSELKDTQIPIQLLTGEYDYSASPDNTRTLANLINTAEFTEMRNLGHFPMIENPHLFRGHLIAALERISQRHAKG